MHSDSVTRKIDHYVYNVTYFVGAKEKEAFFGGKRFTGNRQVEEMARQRIEEIEQSTEYSILHIACPTAAMNNVNGKLIFTKDN
jgi:hypothetical protein